MRSCYSVPVRFYNDSEKLHRIAWYFVPDDRAVLGMETAFSSRIYEREEELEGDLGERFSPVPWRGGEAPCPEVNGIPCGSKEEWVYGVSELESVTTWPGTLIPECCPPPLLGNCGGMAFGTCGSARCIMDTTFDSYRPFGAGSLLTNVECVLVSALEEGRGSSPINTVVWTHYIEVEISTDILDGVTRTATLNVLAYADGDEVRIPSGGATRYVVVWVTLCDSEGTTVKRAYLMRHSA